MNDIFGDIYVITNLKNKKKYVGQSRALRGGFSYRWSQHLNDAKSKNPQSAIASSIKKHGKENFKIELIERRFFKNRRECMDWLNNSEMYYIEKFNSFNNGYNCTPGGDSLRYSRFGASNHRSRPVGMYSMDGKFLRKFDSIELAAKFIKGHPTSISLCCRKKIKSSMGYIWMFYSGESDLGLEHVRDAKNSRLSYIGYPVSQFSLDGKLVNRFKNSTEANKATGVNKSTINKCCIEKNGTAGGFIWMRDGFEYELTKNKLDSIRSMYYNKKGVPVKCYSINGVLLSEYTSAFQAFLSTGIAAGSILRCCNMKPNSKTAGGLVWCFSGMEDMLNFDMDHLSPTMPYKKIYVYDNMGNLVKTYKSGVHASIETGIGKKMISRYILKNMKFPDGTVWTYNLK